MTKEKTLIIIDDKNDKRKKYIEIVDEKLVFNLLPKEERERYKLQSTEYVNVSDFIYGIVSEKLKLQQEDNHQIYELIKDKALSKSKSQNATTEKEQKSIVTKKKQKQ